MWNASYYFITNQIYICCWQSNEVVKTNRHHMIYRMFILKSKSPGHTLFIINLIVFNHCGMCTSSYNLWQGSQTYSIFLKYYIKNIKAIYPGNDTFHIIMRSKMDIKIRYALFIITKNKVHFWAFASFKFLSQTEFN